LLNGLQSTSYPHDVVKRSGAIVPFDGGKIRAAVTRAGAATGEFAEAEAELLTSQAMKVLNHRFGAKAPHIEQIQDVVEQVLISANHFATARAYIVYREQHARLRRDRERESALTHPAPPDPADDHCFPGPARRGRCRSAAS